MPTVRAFAVLTDEARKGEEVRFSIEKYKNKLRVDLRLFVWNEESKSFIPTRRGLALTKKMTIQLRNALSAISESQLHDLLAPPTPSPANQATTQGTPTAGTTTTDLPGGG